MIKITKIGLVFENCDYVEYEYGKDFRYFDAGNVHVKFLNYFNGVSKYYAVDGFAITLTKEANTERLENDCTNLNLTYSDGSAETYSVLWPEDCQYYHTGQKKKVTELGNTLFVSEHGDYKVMNYLLDEDNIDASCQKLR